jgi:hypothetical protein
MRCFRHHEVEAVGLCKHCFKAVCSDCAEEVDGSVACAASCEDEVRALNYLMARATRMYKASPKQWTPSMVIGGLGGMLLLGWGIYQIDSKASYLLIGLGVIMLISGVFSFLNARRYSEMANEPSNQANAADAKKARG